MLPREKGAGGRIITSLRHNSQLFIKGVGGQICCIYLMLGNKLTTSVILLNSIIGTFEAVKIKIK